jgi:hypothetical protein
MALLAIVQQKEGITLSAICEQGWQHFLANRRKKLPQFVLESQDQVDSCLMIDPDGFPRIPSCIHNEIFKLCAVLFPLHGMRLAAESRWRALSTMAPFAREFQDQIAGLAPFLQTGISIAA